MLEPSSIDRWARLIVRHLLGVRAGQKVVVRGIPEAPLLLLAVFKGALRAAGECTLESPLKPGVHLVQL